MRKQKSMDVLLYDESGKVSERLIELTGVTVNEIHFYRVATIMQLMEMAAEHQPAVIILHWTYANREAAAVLKKITAACNLPVVIMLFDVADDYYEPMFNIRNCSYVFDTYKDFDKIPGIIRELKKKNQAYRN